MNLSIGILTGLGAMIGWGTSDFLAALASRKIGSFRALFWMSAVTLGVMGFYFLTSPANFNFSLQIIFFLCLVGFLQDIGTLYFYKSLEIGRVSLVSPIAGSWAAWTVVLSTLFLKETLLRTQTLGVILIIGGVILVSTKINQLLKEAEFIFSDIGVKFAFLASVFWGTSFVIYKPIIDKAGWFPSTTILYIFIVFWLFVYSWITKKKLYFEPKKEVVVLIVSISLANILAWFVYSFGLEKNLASIISPIASTFPLVTVILARIFFKEKLVWNQILGIAGVIGGLVLLSL